MILHFIIVTGNLKTYGKETDYLQENRTFICICAEMNEGVIEGI